MTPEELTRAVAERCMGWTEVRSTSCQSDLWGYHDIGWQDVPAYATDVTAAWEVVEWMRRHGSVTIDLGNVHDQVHVAYKSRGPQTWAPTMPEAVCLCALAVADQEKEAKL